MSPRLLLVVVLSLVTGFILGRLGPHADLREMRGQVEKLEQNLEDRHQAGGGALSGVRSMLKVSGEDLETKASREEMDDQHAEAAPPATRPVSETNQVLESALSDAAFTSSFEQVKSAWALRSELARTNFVARTKLNAQQAVDFNVLVEAMNLRIGNTIDIWSARIRDDRDMDSETGVRMMTDLGNAVVLTYNEMDRKMPPEWRQDAGEQFDLIDLIDPEVLTPLMELDEKFGGAD